MKKNNKVKLWMIGLFAVVLFLIVPLTTDAATFNPNNLMSDEYFRTTGTMSVEQIQAFLDEQPGVLKNLKVKWQDGRERSVAQTFKEVSDRFKINVEPLIMLVEKEQSLISNPRPSQKSINWATGFGSLSNKRFAGFYNQVYYAGKKLGNDYWEYRDYYSWFQVGKTTATLDGYRVTPENFNTCAWYIYNPLQGASNQRFGANWLLWHLINIRYKEGLARHSGAGAVAGAETNANTQADSSQYFYRNGTVIRLAGDNRVFLVENGQKHEFTGSNALKTRYHRSEIVTVGQKEFSAYPTGANVGLQEGLAVQRSKGGPVYIVSDGELRGVSNLEALGNLGYTTSDIVKITDKEANFHKVGGELKGNDFVNGQLVGSKESGAVYQFKNNQLFPIWDRRVKNSQFEYHPVKLISQEELGKYQIMTEQPIQFRNGLLISATEGKNAGGVYIVSGDKLSGFTSREALDSAGYDIENVVQIPNSLLELHEVGREI